MKGRFLTETQIAAFAVYLESEEKSENTVEKYIRDVKAFAAYAENNEITKETGKLFAGSFPGKSVEEVCDPLRCGHLSLAGNKSACDGIYERNKSGNRTAVHS